MYLSYRMLAQHEKDSGFTTNTASINKNKWLYIYFTSKLSVRKEEKTKQNNLVPKTLTFKSILTRNHWYPHYDLTNTSQYVPLSHLLVNLSVLVKWEQGYPYLTGITESQWHTDLQNCHT